MSTNEFWLQLENHKTDKCPHFTSRF